VAVVGPSDSLLAVLRALGLPVLAITILTMLNFLWSWISFILDGVHFGSAAAKSLQELVRSRSRPRTRAILQAILAQASAIIVVYSGTGLAIEFVALGGSFEQLRGYYIQHPNGVVASTAAVSTIVVLLCLASAFAFGESLVTLVLIVAEYCVSGYFGLLGVLSVLNLLLAISTSQPSSVTVQWLLITLALAGLCFGMLVAARTPFDNLHG